MHVAIIKDSWQIVGARSTWTLWNQEIYLRSSARTLGIDKKKADAAYRIQRYFENEIPQIVTDKEALQRGGGERTSERTGSSVLCLRVRAFAVTDTSYFSLSNGSPIRFFLRFTVLCRLLKHWSIRTTCFLFHYLVSC